MLAQIAARNADRLRVVKLNVDENPVTAAAHRINGMPTLNLFRGGRIVHQIRGTKPMGALLRDLDGYAD